MDDRDVSPPAEERFPGQFAAQEAERQAQAARDNAPYVKIRVATIFAGVLLANVTTALIVAVLYYVVTH